MKNIENLRRFAWFNGYVQNPLNHHTEVFE